MECEISAEERDIAIIASRRGEGEVILTLSEKVFIKILSHGESRND